MEPQSLLEFAGQFGMGFAAALTLIVVTLAALRKFVPHLKMFQNGNAQKTDLTPLTSQVSEIKYKIDVLYDTRDRKNFEEAIEKLSDAIVELSTSLKEISIIQREMRRDIDRLSDLMQKK